MASGSTIREIITGKLTAAFGPEYLDVVNESNNHNVPEGSESHFRVTLVSDVFEGQRLIQRHRQVNASLNELLADSIHALALHTYTPQEWVLRQAKVPSSPDCQGNSK